MQEDNDGDDDLLSQVTAEEDEDDEGDVKAKA